MTTLGTLADEWLALDCPHNARRPRTSSAADALALVLGRALDFWRDIKPNRVRASMFERFAQHRADTARANFTGERSTDLQLAAHQKEPVSELICAYIRFLAR